MMANWVGPDSDEGFQIAAVAERNRCPEQKQAAAVLQRNLSLCVPSHENYSIFVEI